MFQQTWKLIFLIVFIVLIFLWIIKAPIMSSYLTKKLGVPITLRTISMWPHKSTMHHFRIANPEGYKTRTALEVDKTQVDYQWATLVGNPAQIDLITLDGLFLNIYINNVSGTDNNWAAIGAEMPSTREGKEVIVHKLLLKNMTVKTEGPGAQLLGVSGTQHFDQMEFDEISSKHGFPTKELIAQIFHGAGLRKYLEKFLNPTQRIKEALNPFQIFGENDIEKAPLKEGPEN